MNAKKMIIIPILLFVFGVSYAFYQYFRLGESNDEIVAGQIYMKYADSNTLYLTNVFPETKEEALKEGRTDNEIRFSIKGKNEYKKDIYYEINLNLGEELEDKNRIRPEDIMIYLECDGEVLIDGMTYEEWNETCIWVNAVPANTLEEITKNYVLKAWIREDILISDTNPNANYTADDWNLSYVSLKLSVYGDFVERKLYISDVQLFDKVNANGIINAYNETSFDSTVELSNDNNNLETFVTFEVTITNKSTYLYSYSDTVFTLGAGTYDNENIVFDITGISKNDEISPGESKKIFITFRYDDPTSVTNNILNSKVNFVFKNLSATSLSKLILSNESQNNNGSFYKYGDTYYYGGTDVNNYMWFNCKDGYESGSNYCEKWRIVSVDEMGNVKIVKHDVVGKEQISSLETETNFWNNMAGTWVRDSKILLDGKVIYDYKGKRPLNVNLENSYCTSTNNGCNAYSSDANIITGSYKSLAVDRDSMVKMYLDDVYYQYGLTASAISRIKKSVLYIGLVGVGLDIEKVLLNERSIVSESYVGLLNVSDYIFSSNNEKCKTDFTKYYNNDCVVNNWLKLNDKHYIILNGKLLAEGDRNAQIWTIRNDGAIYSQDATNEFYLRPVVTLKADTKAIGLGKNSEADYYTLVYE